MDRDEAEGLGEGLVLSEFTFEFAMKMPFGAFPQHEHISEVRPRPWL